MSDPSKSSANCPICDKPRKEQFAPFCSRRCADLDLGAWLKGGYVIPAAPDEAQVTAAVREAMAQVGAEGPKDMGRVMKPALDRLGPAADGKLVSQIAKRLLSEAADS